MTASAHHGAPTTVAEPPFVVRGALAQKMVILTAFLAAFMSLLDAYIVMVSIPVIAHDLVATTSEVARIVLVYFLMLTSTLLLFGRLADQYGVRKILGIGFIVFTVGSLLCGLSHTLAALLAARAVQGLGAAMLGATMYSVVTRFLPHAARGRGLAMLAIAAALGVSAGAPLGGLITSFLGWHWIFFINVPIGIASFFLALNALPREPAQQKRPLDIGGTILSFAGLFCLLFGLNNGQEEGWGSATVIGLFVAFLLFTACFAAWERRCRNPLLDLALFAERRFVASLAANLFCFMIMAGGNYLVPFYLMLTRGVDECASGFILLIYSAAIALLSPFVGRLLSPGRAGAMAVGGAMGFMTNCLIFVVLLPRPGLFPVCAYLFVLGLAAAVCVTSNNYLATSLAPEGKQGSISGMLRLAINLGQALGVAFLETIFSQFLPASSGCGGSLSRSGLPPEALYPAFRYAFAASILLGLSAATFSFFSARNLGTKKAIIDVAETSPCNY